jgi:hypothetical protein
MGFASEDPLTVTEFMLVSSLLEKNRLKVRTPKQTILQFVLCMSVVGVPIFVGGVFKTVRGVASFFRTFSASSFGRDLLRFDIPARSF